MGMRNVIWLRLGIFTQILTSLTGELTKDTIGYSVSYGIRSKFLTNLVAKIIISSPTTVSLACGRKSP